MSSISHVTSLYWSWFDLMLFAYSSSCLIFFMFSASVSTLSSHSGSTCTHFAIFWMVFAWSSGLAAANAAFPFKYASTSAWSRLPCPNRSCMIVLFLLV